MTGLAHMISSSTASATTAFQQGSEPLRQQIQQQVQQQIEQAQQAAAQAQQDAAQQLRDRAESDAGRAAPGFSVGPGGTIQPLDAGAAGTVALQGVPLPPPTSDIPSGAVTLALAFFIMLAVIAIGTPIARAIARRIDRGPAAPAKPSAEQSEQLRHIQTAVDAMAVEVERVSENQRFVTRLLTEGGAPEAALLERQLGARAGEAEAPAAPRTDAR